MPNFETIANPEDVFEASYWGEAVDMANIIKPIPTTNKNRNQSKQLLAEMVPKVLSGEQQGQVLYAGKLDSYDRELSRISPHNMPGSMLIIDTETLYPLGEFSSETLREPWTAINCNINEIGMSPRDLLQLHSYIVIQNDAKHIAFQPAELNLSNESHRYLRKTALYHLIPNKKGTSTPYIVQSYINRLPDSACQCSPSLDLYPNYSNSVQIGETYKLQSPSANGKRLLNGIIRVSSVELCYKGETVQAKSPAFARALGRLAHSG